MSNQSNTLLLEWAGELMEELPDTAAKAIQRDIDSGDLEALKKTVAHYAAELSQEKAHNYDFYVY